MVQLTAAHAAKRGLRRVLLLGTQFTMEDGYFHRHLERYGIEHTIPILNPVELQCRAAVGFVLTD
jgi:aspartate/glutamate racemase